MKDIHQNAINIMMGWRDISNEHDGRRNTTSEAPETCDHDNFFILHDDA